jgi:hypothetical protein
VRSQQLMKARSRTLLLSKLRGLVLASQVHKPRDPNWHLYIRTL